MQLLNTGTACTGSDSINCITDEPLANISGKFHQSCRRFLNISIV